jgi:uncharacterized protein (TIGR02271 family)
MARTVVGYFRDRAAADRAYDALVQRGFGKDEISIIGRGADGKTETAGEAHHVTAGEGAATGGILGLLLGAAAMLIPGIGPIVAVGPIAAGLAGAVTGGVTGAVVGGVAGALVHAGVPEEEARFHEERLKQGGYLLTVHADDARYQDARMILERSGAELHGGNVQAAATHTGEGERSVELREEQLRARKETVEAGEVALRKDVVTEQKSMEVPVTREEVVVERHPVADRPAGGEIREGEEIRVPVREEQVRLDKEAVVTEEVSIGKRPIPETEHVAGTVRREEVRVEPEGDVDVRREDTPRTPRS